MYVQKKAVRIQAWQLGTNKEKEAELKELLERLDSEIAEKDNESYRRSHAHFSAKA